MKSSKNREEYLKYRRDCNEKRKDKNRQQGFDNKFKYMMEKTKCKCEICGERFPIDVLDVHHIDPAKKKFSVKIDRFRGMTKETIDELAKCAILCCNCHRLEHIALKNGETLINDKEAYSRYRNHRFSSYKGLDDRDERHTNGDEEEFPCAPI